MHDRNADVHQLALYVKAPGGSDVLQVDAAERWAEVLHDGYNLIRVLSPHTEREGVDVGELLEEDGLAFKAAQEACLDKRVRNARLAALGAFACLLAGAAWFWQRGRSGLT